MSYFDNANTTVTRKSFGSKVDKTFQREGVVPVKDRKKDEKDVVAESTKYNELNKKVENRRINDMVENRKYEIKLQEGYTKLKDELIKDFLSEICVESLLVDEKVVTANLKNIVSMVEEKVDTIGGFEGVKDIAESTQNPILLNMVSICEAVCKKVGERNLKESDKNVEKLNFSLNKDEMNDFDYRKKEMGTESIVNTIKDKVFQVVQDEQKLNTERQEVMTEIENKVQELNAPVQEAMDFIFNQNKIEETTLFDSLMRSHYKQLLETESSAIFESMDYQEEDEEIVFEEQEFSMSDVELEGCKKKKCGESCDECEDDDDDDEYDDDEYDEDDDDECEDGECVEEAINQKKFQKKSRKMSDAKLQNKIVKWEKDIAATKAKIKQESDPDYLNDYKEDLKILNAELKVFKNELDHRNKQAKIKTNIYAKESVNNIFDDIFDEDTIDVDNLMESIDVFVAEINQDIENIKSKSEAIACKESVRQFQQDIEDVLTEGLGFKVLDAKIANFFNNLLSKKLSKRDYDKVRKNLTTMINDGNLTLTDIKALEADLRVGKKQLNRAKERYPESKEEIEKHIQWLDTTYKQMLANKKKELKGKIMKESMLPSVESVYSLMEARYRSTLDNNEEACGNKKTCEACGKKLDEACGDKKTCEACGKKLDEACGDKKTCEACSKKAQEACGSKKTCEACGKKAQEACGNKKTCEACGKKVKEEIVVCPDCGKEKCICDEACGKKVKEACNKKKACKEALIAKLDECCETLNTIIESHELSYNNAIESLMLNMGDTNILVPYLQSKDCDMSNLEFVYKTKLVCETLKDSLKTIENNNDLSVLNKAVELNINSINETMEIIKDNESLSYKNRILNSGRQYLTKLHNIIESIEIPETELSTTMESSVFNSEEDVEKIFNMVKEYYVIESTNKDMMELVMAEAIVDYTIMEAFNTLNLVKYDKEIVRQMSRKNISYVSEGLFGKK